jgi:hypothetical protein
MRCRAVCRLESSCQRRMAATTCRHVAQMSILPVGALTSSAAWWLASASLFSSRCICYDLPWRMCRAGRLKAFAWIKRGRSIGVLKDIVKIRMSDCEEVRTEISLRMEGVRPESRSLEPVDPWFRGERPAIQCKHVSGCRTPKIRCRRLRNTARRVGCGRKNAGRTIAQARATTAW